MTEEPITKKSIAQEEKRNGRLRHLPFMWRVLERFANAFVPLIVLSIIAGFTFACVVTLFTWGWEIIR